jgi:hypothetical protein
MVLERSDDMITFTTYTVLDNVCIFNHKSNHRLNYNVLNGSINLFDYVDNLDDDLWDLKRYIEQFLKEVLKKKDTFKWDIIKTDDTVQSNQDNTFIHETKKGDMVRALKMYSDGRLEYIDYNIYKSLEDNNLKDFMNGDYEGVTLRGGSHEGYRLAMFISFGSNEVNRIASTIYSYLRDENWIKVRRLTGNALLVDDNIRLNQNNFKQLMTFIDSKIKRQMPTNLKKHINNLRKEYNNRPKKEADSLYYNLVKMTIDNSKQYGRIIIFLSKIINMFLQVSRHLTFYL